MEDATDFPIRRRTDGSIDTQFYAGRARRLHSDSFSVAAARLAAWFRGRTGAPTAVPARSDQLAIRRRPA